LLRNPTDGDHNVFKILDYVTIRESEHTISTRSKPFIAPAVATDAGFEVVTLAVDLNNNLAGARDEVRNVITHWTLSTKSESCKSMRFQMPPQQGFGARRGAPWMLGASSLNLADLVMPHSPLPNPPPQGGRENYSGNRIERNHSFPITSPRKP
jgi:hypothetical protein